MIPPSPCRPIHMLPSMPRARASMGNHPEYSLNGRGELDVSYVLHCVRSNLASPESHVPIQRLSSESRYNLTTRFPGSPEFSVLYKVQWAPSKRTSPRSVPIHFTPSRSMARAYTFSLGNSEL